MRPTPADPDAWNAYLAEGNATQVRKRVAADVLIRDSSGRVLLVNPTYKPGWDLPGDMAEANEPPHVAAIREVKEELGLLIALRSLLVVDWVSSHGPWDDQLSFIFDAGTLDDETSAAMHPHDSELSEVRFVPLGTASTMLRERLANRFQVAVRALQDGSTAYLHDGRTALP
ncbi:NUDIX hydrolase [Streptomyces sp. NTH33]|uniref:NUDIX domain-containing protein n=1 Tax=Streptomyces sp. NTH33 TaxID=1735453 RepID=UPI000DA8159D|nr:NUDIX hydrolase [Streptomyces sp. NTH33]PZH20173.1 NUDIX hydrolase [Streptomyces sp. NTH33]